MAEMIRKTIKGGVQSADDSTRSIRHIITSLTVDRDGEVVVPKGVKTDNFKDNPVVLFAHDYNSLPIGKNIALRVEDDKIIATTQFADTELGREAYKLYKEGFMNAWSIGFISLKSSDEKVLPNQTGKTYQEWELLEYSAVSVPSNPQALTVARSKGFDISEIEKIMKGDENSEMGLDKEETEVEQKGVIPFKKHPLADPNAKWDAAKEIKQATEKNLYEMCAWYDKTAPDPNGDGLPDNKSAYKLPHHYVKNYVTVWKGVAAAMAALLGARGGVAIPDKDKKGVYNHLAKHYEEFGKKPPAFKEYENEEEILKACGIEEIDTDVGTKSGRVLSEASRKKLQNAIEALKSAQTALEELLKLSETQTNSSPLGESKSEEGKELTEVLEGLKKALSV